MFRWLKSLFASRDLSLASRVKLEQRRAICAERIRNAEQRHDDRDLGRALMEMRQATTDLLRVEVGR